MGMKLQGKAFLPTEDKMSIIVNEEVGKIMNNPNPVGHYLYREGAREIKAVVPDFIAGTIQSKMQPTVFVKYTKPSVYSTLSIRLTKNRQKEAIEEIKAAISKIVPDQYFQIRFYNADIDESYKFDRTVEKTISFFTLLAILITISGLVGFSINMVKKRSKEIGIRKVSGASSLSILLLLNRHFILNTLIALLLFIPLSYLLVVIWLENYAYAVSISPFVFIVASVLLVFIVLLIVSLASLRYAQIDPVKTIRYE
jgi:putative ABC transport system permease protein